MPTPHEGATPTVAPPRRVEPEADLTGDGFLPRVPPWAPIPVAVFLVTLSLIVWRLSSRAPVIVLAACLAVSVLLTLTLYLAQLVARRAARLAAANRELEREIELRRRAEEQVRQLNRALADRVRELEAANRELESFSYSVSHDLRAPLRHLAGFADLLSEQSADRLDDAGRRYLSLIGSAAEKMGRLIDDLLAFSRAGRAALDPRPVELGPLVREVIEIVQPPTADRAVEWSVGDLPAVRADPVLLRTVIQNLLDNAVKFTRGRAPARIEIGAEPANGSGTLIWVRDNGAGFDPRYARKLFGIFQRLHRQDEFEGTGVGLANVQRIVHRHGGRIWAEGEPDRGATFYFTLPAA